MSPVRCDEFERWLDHGDPGAPPGAMLEHARECARCGAALTHARALDALLAGALPARAPAGFTDAVLARLDAAPRRAPATPPAPLADPMPLAARIAMDPATALALTLAAVCTWQGPRLVAAARVLTMALGASLTPHAAPAPPWLLVLGVAPLVALATVALYRGGEALAATSARPGIRRL